MYYDGDEKMAWCNIRFQALDAKLPRRILTDAHRNDIQRRAVKPCHCEEAEWERG